MHTMPEMTGNSKSAKQQPKINYQKKLEAILADIEEKQKQDIGEFMDNFENNIDDDFEEQIENVESETKNDSNN